LSVGVKVSAVVVGRIYVKVAIESESKGLGDESERVVMVKRESDVDCVY